MGIQNLAITLSDNPTGVFFASQEVKGIATITVGGKDKVKVKGIRVKLAGKGHCNWTDYDESDEGDIRSANETYVDVSTVVFPTSHPYGGSEENALLPGKHNFPFTFTIPENAPSSFEGKHGHIRYYIKLRVTCSTFSFDSTKKLFFTVAGILDLNRITTPNVEEPVVKKNSKTVTTFLVKQGKVTATLNVNRSGFVCGEKVNFSVLVDNDCKVSVRALEAYLKQTVKYRAEGYVKTKVVTLEWMKRQEKILAHTTFEWKDLFFKVPPVAPTSLDKCKIMEIKYTFEMHVLPSGPHSRMVLEIPLIIGTVPLKTNFSNFQRIDALPSAPSIQSLYPELPPPSYSEAASMDDFDLKRDDDGDREVQANWDYKPKYPLWNIQ